MLKDIVKEVFARDLDKLVQEIKLYQHNDTLWTKLPGTTNPGGNLVLHICGNLNHFVGAQLGGTGYVRQREREFTDTGYSQDDLVAKVKFTAHMIEDVLEEMGEKDLAKTYPLEVLGKSTTTGFFLTHLAAHLNYHLGQINYHRRLVSTTQEKQ